MEIRDGRILMDCDELSPETRKMVEEFFFNRDKDDLLIVRHAHVDHAASTPEVPNILVKQVGG